MDYDWDSVQVGRPELNSSQNFFRNRHVLHEKEGDKLKDFRVIKPQQQKQQTVGTGAAKVAIGAASKAKQTNQLQQDKENVSTNSSASNFHDRAILAISIVQKPSGPMGRAKPSMLKSTLKKSLSVPTALAADLKKKPIEKADSVGSKKVIHNSNIGQRQFDYAKIQEKRKEMLIQKAKEEETKQLKYQFHANPVPNFKKPPIVVQRPPVEQKKLTRQASLPQISVQSRKTAPKECNFVPSCADPDRLKYLEEKKRQLVAKYHDPPVQFKAKPAAVLKKLPFQPVYNNAKVIDARPFKLQLTERLIQRSQYDKKLHETIAIRKKQEDIRKRQQDFEDRRLLRQKTEFRANPIRRFH